MVAVSTFLKGIVCFSALRVLIKEKPFSALSSPKAGLLLPSSDIWQPTFAAQVLRTERSDDWQIKANLNEVLTINCSGQIIPIA